MFRILIISLITFMIVIIVFLIFISFMNTSLEKFTNDDVNSNNFKITNGFQYDIDNITSAIKFTDNGFITFNKTTHMTCSTSKF